MAAPIKLALEYVKQFWQRISFTQRMLVAALAAIMIMVFVVLMVWLGGTDYSVLYSNLSPEDANRVIRSLESQKIPFQLDQNGTVIKVPADKVHMTRIQIAGDNILAGTSIGLDYFDKVQMGATDFSQKVNYQRALQGELSRTIKEFPSVENAMVHLVLPRKSLFIEEQQKPSAAVVLKIAGDQRVEPKDVQAIVNMMIMSVEGLEKDKVSITDTNGRVLYHPEEEGSLYGLTKTQLEHKLAVQKNLERRVEEMLMPVIGVGKVIAKVNADIDFSQRKIYKKNFDPEKTVLIGESRAESSMQGTASIEGGIADPNFRGDGPTGTTSGQNSTTEQRTSNYEVDSEIQDIIGSVGGINRLTVAVIVDGSYTTNEEGESVFVPRNEEELNRIRQLVSNAVGFDTARGDTIEVSNIAFTSLDIPTDDSLGSVIADYALRFGKPMLNALLIFLFLMFVLRPVVMALIRPKVEGQLIEGLEGLPQTEERLALVEADDETLAAHAVVDKIEDIKAHALQMSEQNMEQAIGIIKSWLKESVENLAAPAKIAA